MEDAIKFIDKIDIANNFCRVFELPSEYPRGFCFGGGKPVNFQMVDWFNPIPTEDLHSGKDTTWIEYEVKLREFLKDKIYVKSGRKYILITNFNESFIFTKEE